MADEQLHPLKRRLEQAVSIVDEIDVLNELAWELREHDTRQAYTLSERALRLAKSGEFAQYPYVKGVAFSLRTLGYLSITRGELGLALNQLIEANALLENLPYPEVIATTIQGIGWAHFCLGNYSEAISCLQNALEVDRRSGNCKHQAAVLASLGSVYARSGDRQKAFQAFQDSLELQPEAEITRDLVVTLNNLAITQARAGLLKQAQENAEKGLEMVRKIGYRNIETALLDTLGQVYLGMQTFLQAARSFEEAWAVSKEIQAESQEMGILVNLGRTYFLQNQPAQAITLLKQAIELATTRHASQYIYRYHELLSEIYESQGDLPQALEHFKQFHSLSEAAYKEAAGYRLKNLETLHQVETTVKESEILNLQNQALEHEMDESRKAQAVLEKLATTDGLTGLFSRRHFLNLGEFEFNKAIQGRLPLAVIMLDLDFFKQVNDRYGHFAGDQVLITVANYLRQNTRDADILCRYGGEEFIILLPATRAAAAQNIAERFRCQVATSSTQVNNVAITVTASFGVAELNAQVDQLITLLNRADQALYQAKQAGRNCTRVFEE